MTGLIYVAIIAVWAAVLVPMWLRRQDHANEARTVERFNAAMHTLNRSRDGAQGRPAGRRPAGDAPTAARDGQRTSASQRRAQRGVAGPDTARGAGSRRGTVARRRRALLVVVVTLAAAVVTVVLGLLPAPVLAVPVAGLAVFGLTAGGTGSASTARSAPARARTRVAPAAGASSDSHRGAEVYPYRPRRQPQRQPVEQPAALAATGTDDRLATDGWEPVPTTLPTYVNAPRATGLPRVIDLTTPGSWTSAAMLEHARHVRSRTQYEQQQSALAEESGDDYAYYAGYTTAQHHGARRRRAVNG